MATLYRCTTPTNWLCPCGKVARALKHEEIAFTEVRVPQRRSRRPEVEALTDQRRVPVLVIDGEAICDSRRIVEHLRWRRAGGDAGSETHPGGEKSSQSRAVRG
ncbi:MAG TPA: glutathione S-transferase N-terminal domain-containing protein [Solirubrobacteraceae bacterium]|nr:glutathione S-transferase N-terminal domain-containing protein [Solirubrobacteraceae bacterium]